MTLYKWEAGVFLGSPPEAADTDTEVHVYEAGTTTHVTIYADRDGTAKSNPFNVTTAGEIKFYTDCGLHKIVASNGVNTKTWDDELIGNGNLIKSNGSAGYTLSKSLHKHFHVMNNSDHQIITIPKIATHNCKLAGGVRYEHSVYFKGTGSITIQGQTTGAGSVTIKPPKNSTLEMTQPYQGVTFIMEDEVTDSWICLGITDALV